ncbi:MAG: hypothetical protein ACYC5O_10390 [Anaerolineae bacterium]
MSERDVIATLEEGLAEIPLLDAHTHLDAQHLAARGLHDVLLYHMVISDLVSAGCPSRARLSEHPDEGEATARLQEAVPYVPRILNTSCFWGVRLILRHLYDWNEPITADNWPRLHAIIRERSQEASWPREILRRAGIRRACTEFSRRHDGSADDVFQYALEWAFFTRAQWGANDIPLYELERAWNQPGPSEPLPVTLGEARPAVARPIRTVADADEAVAYYVSKIPYGEVLATIQHISTNISLRQVTAAEMATALEHRDAAMPADRDVYASYILERFLTALEAHGDEIVYQFSFGAEPLPYETGSKLRQESIFELAAIIERHPKLRFQASLSSAHGNQALCTLARELPNFSLAGYWWHNFFPTIIRRVIGERLDMVAQNKHAGFFSDAYCVDWAYAKAVIVRKQWAVVLSERVIQGQYTVDEALAIARQALYQTPYDLLGMRPRLDVV